MHIKFYQTQKGGARYRKYNGPIFPISFCLYDVLLLYLFGELKL